jgi:hypothetical protein
MSNDLYVIDASVIDKPSSIAGLPAEARIVVIAPEVDGLVQLQTALIGSTGYDSLQIVTHGSAERALADKDESRGRSPGRACQGAAEAGRAGAESHQPAG